MLMDFLWNFPLNLSIYKILISVRPSVTNFKRDRNGTIEKQFGEVQRGEGLQSIVD